jgi:transketolase
MRTQFCEAMVARADRPNLVFLTGDLGFMALEPLRDALGMRFVNAGVSEQNMVSVAAGLAKQGLEAWTYSIAPFIYARAFEQIRNDIAFHNLAVRIVGNGGGYGYGVMGPTHHAIEDYGILLTLPNMKAFVPVFDQDLHDVIARTDSHIGPSYLRLGRGETSPDYLVPQYAPWRQLVEGSGGVVVAVGPLAGSYIAACAGLDPAERPNLWAVAELPLSKNPLPEKLLSQIIDSGAVIVAEEHVVQGSLGADLGHMLMRRGLCGLKFAHLHATAHHFSGYGSQQFLRKQSNLDAQALLATIAELSRQERT